MALQYKPLFYSGCCTGLLSGYYRLRSQSLVKIEPYVVIYGSNNAS